MNARALLLAVIALVPAACGDDERKEFVERADRICAQGASEVDGLADPDSVGEVRQWAARSSEIGRETLRQLEELDAPDEVADEFEQYVDYLDFRLDRTDEIAQARTLDEVRAISERSARPEIDRMMEDAGFHVCGRNPD